MERAAGFPEVPVSAVGGRRVCGLAGASTPQEEAGVRLVSASQARNVSLNLHNGCHPGSRPDRGGGAESEGELKAKAFSLLATDLL